MANTKSTERPAVKTRERDAILQALRSGVVPKMGLQHIQVGRALEVKELAKDLDKIGEGSAAIRLIIGEYGSGKTFFLNLIRMIALQKGMVAMSADLAPDRRLHASGGQARSLFAELTRNTATRTKPSDGALSSVVERFVTQAMRTAEQQDCEPDEVIREKLSHLEEMHGGFDFAAVVARYWEGHEKGDDELKANALRWLRAEFATRTDARTALGVRTIIDDKNVYDHLKLYSAFVKEAGYKGLVVVLDEMVNLYKLSSSQARNSNYEQILRILNDVLQGSASHLEVLMGGTPEFLMDTRRGLYSYPALQSRLAENTFASDSLIDLSVPVIQLANLSPEDLYILLQNIRYVFQFEDQERVPDKALEAFMQHCSKRIGDAYFRTPRNTVISFVNLLSVLEQNPNANWQELVGQTDVAKDEVAVLGAAIENHDTSASQSGQQQKDDLETFKL